MTDAQVDAAVRRLVAPFPASTADKVTDRTVLLVIAVGLITILLAIIVGLLLTPRALPNWAENVFVSIATATALKLGDCINALVALSSSRTTERMGLHLAASAPPAGDAATGKPDDPVHTVEEPK